MKLDNTAIQFLSEDNVKCLRIETTNDKIFIHVRWGKGHTDKCNKVFSAEELLEILKGAGK